MTNVRLSCPLLLLGALALAASPEALAQAMKIEIRKEQSVTIVELQGRITIGEGDVTLRGAVGKALAGGARKIVVDLSGATLLDSLAVAALIRIGTEARQEGATFKLLHVEDKVRPVLERTRLIGVFETFDDEIDALNSFGEPSYSKRIYVGNLPFSASDEEVRSLFSEYGTVEAVTLIKDPATGKPAGFGFVDMSSGADEAIAALHQTQMGGRSLNVNEARPRENR